MLIHLYILLSGLNIYLFQREIFLILARILLSDYIQLHNQHNKNTVRMLIYIIEFTK